MESEDNKGNFWISKFLTVSTGAHTTPNIPKINNGILKDFPEKLFTLWNIKN